MYSSNFIVKINTLICVEDNLFTPLGIISLTTHATSTKLWILGKSSLKPKRAHVLFNYMNKTHMPYKISLIRWIHSPHYSLRHQLGSWPTTSSTSIYGSSLSIDSRLAGHIISLILMESSFSNKSSYLHKTTSKPVASCLIKAHGSRSWHIILWSKFMSLIRETLRVMVWRAKKYVQ